MPPSSDLDVAIIGGGHNGLVCACYLAGAGMRVRVFERRDVVGGAAVTEEFHPGFRNSTASYTVSLLDPEIIRDLRLREHGLRIVLRPFSNFLPLSENSYFIHGGDEETRQREMAKFAPGDVTRAATFYARIEQVADVLREIVRQTPPNVGGGLTDLLRAGQFANRLRHLSMPQRRDLLDLFTKSAGEILDYWFEGVPLKAALGFDAVVGNFASPYSAGSAYVLLHHAFGEVEGKRGVWGHAIGGMGAITQAMAMEARARGVEIALNAPVARVDVRNGRARSVVLGDGSEHTARCVVGNVNPRLLYLNMVDASALDDDFRERMARWKCASGTLRMNVALSELPDFTCLPGADNQPHHRSGIIVAPSLEYMDRAYRDARAHGMALQPIVEMLIPSTVDDSLAPPGMHVASLFCQHFDPELGEEWDAYRDAAADLAINTVNHFAPNFKRSIVARKVLTPLDLERTFGLVGGDIFHGALSLDQLYSARPVLGHADYRSPVKGLYLCGSGAHPGGGVSGLPGRNAAREILKDWKARKLR